MSRVSGVFCGWYHTQSFSFYSLASLSLCTFVVFLHLLIVLVFLRHTQTHAQTCTYMYLHISFLWQSQIYAFRPKTLQLPRWLPSPASSQSVCKSVALAVAAIYFRKALGFPFTWVQKQDKYCKVPQLCEKWGGNMRKVKQRHIWATLATVPQGARKGMQTGTCSALHTSWASPESNTDGGDTRAYLRHARSSKFSSTDYFLIAYTAIWKKNLVPALLSYCATSTSSCCSVSHRSLWCACVIGCINLVQLDGRTCKRRIRTHIKYLLEISKAPRQLLLYALSYSYFEYHWDTCLTSEAIPNPDKVLSVE